MLSNDAVKLLKWFEKHDEWITKTEIQRKCNVFDDRSFKALLTKDMIKSRLVDIDGEWAEYRIDDPGKSYLDGIRAKRLPELREWVNFLLPVLTFLGGLLLSEPVKNFVQWFLGLWLK